MSARKVTTLTELEPFPSNDKIPVYSRDFNALVDAVAGAKVYKALIDQSGTDAPVVTSAGGDPLINTFGGAVTYSYIGIGQYRVTFPAGSFPTLATKTIITIGGHYFNGLAMFHISAATINSTTMIDIFVVDEAGNPAEGGLYYHPFTVETYP